MHTVYVVEDDPQVRLIVARFLEHPDLSVTTFASAEAAAKALDEAPPDVALVDVSLPLASGVDLQQFIQDMAPATKILLMSGHGPEFLGHQGLQPGTPFIQKPFTREDVRRAVLALAGQGSAEDLPRFSG
ncbi:MAG: response regulator [Gemmatimonadota bacterium]